MIHCKEADELQSPQTQASQRKTLIVVWISFVTMIVEIVTGTLTGSMALLADGWHMASHVAALLLTYIVYRLADSPSFSKHFTFGPAKLFSLGGFTSSIALAVIAIYMAIEAAVRLYHPVSIEYNEALIVCIVGLVVNIACALILKQDDHHHDHGHDHSHEHGHHHDHNRASALAHVTADALTSVTALVALLIAKNFNVQWIDPLIGMFSSFIILKWSYTLVKKTAYELLDGEVDVTTSKSIQKMVELDGGEIVDFHVWGVGAGKIAAIISVKTSKLKGSAHYHKLIEPHYEFSHLVVEETLR